MFVIEEATITQAKAKVAIVGVAGCGKTYTSLVTARELGKKILVIDTENKTSAKYAKELGPYQIMSLPDYSIKTYVEALEHAAVLGYDVVIVDSLSHAWAGKGGALEQAELAKSRYGGNKFAAWGDVTPLQNRLVDTILNYPAHLIATMRMKIDYATVANENGKSSVQKVGLGIIQRDSFEYEFDIIAQMDIEHNLIVTKTRCSQLDGFMANKPSSEFGRIISGWLTDGEPVKVFNRFEDLLFQLHLDFGLKEDDAKATIKALGFNGLPTNEAARRQRLSEIYAAVKIDVESRKATEPVTVVQDSLGFDVPAPTVKSAVEAGL